MSHLLDRDAPRLPRTWPRGIRPLTHDDLDAVTTLQEEVLRSGRHRPHGTVREHLRRTFLEQPWAEPELLPSLVAEVDGEIVGFLASSPRRMVFDGKPLLVACSSGIVVRPDQRTRALGVMLTKAYLEGPQDLTMADCATEAMRRVWSGLRGSVLVHSSIGWTVPFEPFGLAAGLEFGRGRPGVDRSLRVLGSALRAATPHLGVLRDRLVPAPSELVAGPLTAADLAEQVRGSRRRLRPDYDVAHLRWLFDEIAAVDARATLVRRVLHTSAGRPAGWYVYLLPHHGVAQLLALDTPSGDAEPALDHLVRDAWERGAVGVEGRVEPPQAGFLASRHRLLRRTVWTLVAARDPAVLAVLTTPQAMLGRLDGEWWIGHHLWRDR